MHHPLLLLLILSSLNSCALKSDDVNSVTSSHVAIENDLEHVSARWKQGRSNKDFQILRAHLPQGVSTNQVEALLGEPHGYTQDDGKEFYEYVSNDPENNSSAWTAIFDEKRLLIRWTQDR